jgi:hypothetical protein
LLRAESGEWFLAPVLPLAQDQVTAIVDEFRAELRAVYAAANKPAPAVIAPMRMSTPPPVHASPNPASPAPAATGSYPQAL